MLKLLLAASLFAGCTSESPVARLADLPTPRVVGTNSNLAIEYDTSVDCFTLAPEVTATIDGQPVPVSDITRGGWNDVNAFNGKDCVGIGFSFANLFDTNEAVTSIELADGESTWKLDIQGLAPSSWSIQTPPNVIEGGDVTVAFEPALPGVGVNFISVTPNTNSMPPFVQAPIGNTARITAGFWDGQAQHGSQLEATVDVELGPLPAQRCSGPQSCSFTTDTPSPANHVTIAIP
jgi:hypothetical protein